MNRTEIKRKLVEVFERSVGGPPCAIEESADLKNDLSLDSIAVVAMAIEIQSEFRIGLKASELMRLVVVKDLIDLIQSKIGPGQVQAA